MEREKGGRIERRFALKNVKGLSARGALKILSTVLNNKSFSPFLLVFCSAIGYSADTLYELDTPLR